MKTVVVVSAVVEPRSAAKALERRQPRPGRGDRPARAIVSGADYLVVPGQGAFADCRQGLRSIDGLYEAIATLPLKGTAFLGICIGMQLMATPGARTRVHPGFD